MSSEHSRPPRPETPSPSRPRTVPSGRLSRLARLGGVASQIAAGAMVDGAGHLARGRRPEMRDLLLTPANVSRFANELARMRGAAMKIGQLISMDAGEVLPPELADILARLRADADYMPPKQLRTVLDGEWGRGWLSRFRSFDVRPIAAASIGQVHRARTKDGRDLAIKIQYPGVRRSIDSDVDNVASLMRLSGIMPAGFDITPFLDEAKRQLHEEADYRREGAQLQRFGELLEGDADFLVPTLQDDLTTPNVLAMSFAEGVAIESLASAPRAERDRVIGLLLDLLFREVFVFGLVQTDPNFANYRYDSKSGRVILLDFGAARAFSSEVVTPFRVLLGAAMAGEREAMRVAAIGVGFFEEATAAHHQEAVLEMIDIASVPFRGQEAFDFGDGTLAARIREQGMVLASDRDFVHIPPMDTLYLQRKFAGIYLLASRLKARANLRSLVEGYAS
ncbi:MAG: AarF/ABC1/UbiB kinase family protein [Pseudomonadota bacterium]